MDPEVEVIVVGPTPQDVFDFMISQGYTAEEIEAIAEQLEKDGISL